MALLLASASTQYLTQAGAILTAAPLSFACWFKPTALSVGQDQVLISISNQATASNWFRLGLASNNSFAAFAGTAQAGSEALAIGTVASTAGAWQHYAAVFTSASSRTAYRNGTASTVNTSTETPALTHTPVTALGCYFVHTSTAAVLANGTIAFGAIWNVALSASDVLALANGAHPLTIRPAALVDCPLLIGNNPEVDLVNATGWTPHNSPTLAANPATYYPRHWIAVPSIVVVLLGSSTAQETITASAVLTAATQTVAIGSSTAQETITASATLSTRTQAVLLGSSHAQETVTTSATLSAIQLFLGSSHAQDTITCAAALTPQTQKVALGSSSAQETISASATLTPATINVSLGTSTAEETVTATGTLSAIQLLLGSSTAQETVTSAATLSLVYNTVPIGASTAQETITATATLTPLTSKVVLGASIAQETVTSSAVLTTETQQVSLGASTAQETVMVSAVLSAVSAHVLLGDSIAQETVTTYATLSSVPINVGLGVSVATETVLSSAVLSSVFNVPGVRTPSEEASIFQDFSRVWRPRTPDSSYDSFGVIIDNPPLPRVVPSLALGEGLGTSETLESSSYLTGFTEGSGYEGAGCAVMLASGVYTPP
jgi:concanavalin A-like lectin/glucanase superfamily protein